MILSGDPIEVVKQTNGITYQAGGIQGTAMFVSWRIALKNAGHRLDREAGRTIANAFA